MKNIFLLILISSLFLVSVFAQEAQYFGEKIDESGAITPSEFLKTIEGKDKMDVKLEAKIITPTLHITLVF